MNFPKPLLVTMWAIAFTGASAPAAFAQSGQTHRFSIPAKPLPSALVDFALQAGISVGTEEARRCRPNGNALLGQYTVRQGLDRLLAGTGCTYRLIDAQTVRIVRERFSLRAPQPVAPPPTPSMPPTPPETTELGELIVTSTKRSIGLDRAPYAVSAVDGASLAETASVNTEDLARRIAGLTVTNLGPGRNKLFVRGLSDGALTGRTQATVGLYFDDVRTTYNAPDPDLRLVDIERVELLRGPQGSLYGAGSIGGVLQVITKQPDLENRSGWISVGGEATSGGSAGGVIEGGFNVPIIRDVVALRVVAYREVLGGFMEDQNLGLADVDDTHRQGLRASLRWDISPNWSAGAGFIAQTLNTDDTHYADGTGGATVRSLFLQEPHRNDFDEAHLRLQGDLGWAVLKGTTAFQAHELESRYDATLALPQFSSTASGPAPFDEASDTEALVSEVTLASPTGWRIDWLGGLFSSKFGQSTTSELFSASGARLYGEAREDDIDEYAAYGEATWRITPWLNVTAGGRYFQLSVETKSAVEEPAAPATLFDGKRTEHGFAPKIVVRYEPSRDLVFYIEAAEGYRAGGFNTGGRVGQAFPMPGAGPQPNRLFTGDELTNVEAGARVGLFDNRLRVRAALFQAHWENIQTDQLLPSGLPFTANIGNGHNRGVELEAIYRSGGLRLDANLLVSDPELDSASPDFPHLAGKSLPGVPRILAGAAARYEWDADRAMSRFVSAETSYVGPSVLTFDAATSREMGRYWTTKVAAGLISDRWRFTAYVENLFDSRGDTFAYGNPFSLRMTDQGTPQRPLTVGLILGRTF